MWSQNYKFRPWAIINLYMERKGIKMNLNEISIREIDEHTFGRIIRERREVLGMTVREMAGKVGMTAMYLSDIERGNRYAPRGEKLENLFATLQLSENDRKIFKITAAATRGLYQDINAYLVKQPLARVALRLAEDADLSDEHWQNFIDMLEALDQKNTETKFPEKE